MFQVTATDVNGECYVSALRKAASAEEAIRALAAEIYEALDVDCDLFWSAKPI